MTKIIRCTCTNKYQDRMYGRQLRVANKTEKKMGAMNVYRCTVCTKEIQSK